MNAAGQRGSLRDLSAKEGCMAHRIGASGPLTSAVQPISGRLLPMIRVPQGQRTALGPGHLGRPGSRSCRSLGGNPRRSTRRKQTQAQRSDRCSSHRRRCTTHLLRASPTDSGPTGLAGSSLRASPSDSGLTGLAGSSFRALPTDSGPTVLAASHWFIGTTMSTISWIGRFATLFRVAANATLMLSHWVVGTAMSTICRIVRLRMMPSVAATAAIAFKRAVLLRRSEPARGTAANASKRAVPLRRSGPARGAAAYTSKRGRRLT